MRSKRKFSIVVLLIAIMVMNMTSPLYANADVATDSFDIRLSGKSRYETSYAIADYLYKEKGKFDTVVVASGDNFPDALAGGYLTYVKNAPLILVNKNSEKTTLKEIRKICKPSATVYLLGGTGAVSKNFANSVKTAGYRTKRLGGATRYETNLNILKEAKVNGGELLVASAKNYPDSLSGSAVPKGMLLVGDTLSAEQKEWIKSAGIIKFYILGGEGAVNKRIANDLKKYGLVERIGGSTRYDTSVRIAKRFFRSPKTITLAYSKNFPDGLSGAPIAMEKSAPIILVADDSYADARNYVKEKRIKNDYVFGGTGVIAKQTVDDVMGRLKGKTVSTSEFLSAIEKSVRKRIADASKEQYSINNLVENEYPYLNKYRNRKFNDAKLKSIYEMYMIGLDQQKQAIDIGYRGNSFIDRNGLLWMEGTVNRYSALVTLYNQYNFMKGDKEFEESFPPGLKNQRMYLKVLRTVFSDIEGQLKNNKPIIEFYDDGDGKVTIRITNNTSYLFSGEIKVKLMNKDGYEVDTQTLHLNNFDPKAKKELTFYSKYITKETKYNYELIVTEIAV